MAATLTKIDEESLSNYKPANYYPVQLNDKLGGLYQIKAKLGFGRTSTTWLCADDRGAYKVLKIGNADATRRERDAYEKLTTTTSFTEDQRHHCVRLPESILELTFQRQTYNCFVFPPLGPSLLEFNSQLSTERFGSQRAKIAVTYILLGLAPVHAAGFTHTDLKLDNFQLTLPDPEDAYLDDFCDGGETTSQVQKGNAEDMPIVSRREMKQSQFTHTILCDLGSAVRADEVYSAPVQALPYRAPEVILGAKWDNKIDIWSLGVLAWELIFGQRLFGGSDEHESLGRMIRYLGGPPREFLDRCGKSDGFFDSEGVWKHGSIETTKLEDLIDPATSIPDLLDFIGSALQWDPLERPSAEQLLQHAWLAEMMDG